MEKKNNTMLLTVIAIATLLVAVIGATFAYFSNQVGGEDRSSILKVGSATLTIAYEDKEGPDLRQKFIPAPQADAVFSKTFTLTGTNTSDKAMQYKLSLVVTNSTFEDDDPYEAVDLSGTPIATLPTLEVLNTHEARTTIDGTGLETAAVNGKRSLYANLRSDDYNNGAIGEDEEGVYSYVPSKADMNIRTIEVDAGTTETQNTVTGITFGTGTFAAGANGLTHTYILEIFFKDSGENQDADKNKLFAGYVDISTGSLSINS